MNDQPEHILQRMKTAKWAVASYYNSHLVNGQDELDASKDIYIVWFCKTLQNWKALVSTTVDDGRYYETTYNGDTGELYLDVYQKVDNITIKEELVGGHFEDTGFHTVKAGDREQSVQTVEWVSESKAAGGYTLPPQATADPNKYDIQFKDVPPKKAPGGDWDMHPEDLDPPKNYPHIRTSKDIRFDREIHDPMPVYPNVRLTDHYTEI